MFPFVGMVVNITTRKRSIIHYLQLRSTNSVVNNSLYRVVNLHILFSEYTLYPISVQSVLTGQESADLQSLCRLA
jgi:hypothetical protein